MPNPEQKEMSRWSRLLGRFRRRRFSYLFKSLILLTLVYPYLEENIIGQVLMTMITILVMVTLVIAVSDRKRDYLIALCLAIPWALTLIVDFPMFEGNRAALIRKEIVFAVLLFFYTTVRIFIHLLKSREITSEILFAAVCVYLLIGLSWASLYICINEIYPGSFVDTSGEIANTAPRLLFFSYVTLTTVGYGTLTPVTDQARSLAMVEAITGQLYLTILVARLVGLHISKPRATEDND